MTNLEHYFPDAATAAESIWELQGREGRKFDAWWNFWDYVCSLMPEGLGSGKSEFEMLKQWLEAEHAHRYTEEDAQEGEA